MKKTLPFLLLFTILLVTTVQASSYTANDTLNFSNTCIFQGYKVADDDINTYARNGQCAGGGSPANFTVEYSSNDDYKFGMVNISHRASGVLTFYQVVYCYNSTEKVVIADYNYTAPFIQSNIYFDVPQTCLDYWNGGGQELVTIKSTSPSLSDAYRWYEVDMIVTTPTPPSIIAIDPTTDPSIKIGTNETFSVSVYEPDGDSLSYVWTVDSVDQLNNLSSFVFDTTGLSESSPIIEVTVSEIDGNDSVSWTPTLLFTLPYEADYVAEDLDDIAVDGVASFGVTFVRLASLLAILFLVIFGAKALGRAGKKK